MAVTVTTATAKVYNGTAWVSFPGRIIVTTTPVAVPSLGARIAQNITKLGRSRTKKWTSWV